MDAPEESEEQFNHESWDIQNELDDSHEPQEEVIDWQVDVDVEPVPDHDPDLEEDVLDPEDADEDGSIDHKEQSEEPGHGEGEPGWDGEVEGH